MDDQKLWIVGQRVKAKLPGISAGVPLEIEGTVQRVDSWWLLVETDDGERYDVRSDEVVSI